MVQFLSINFFSWISSIFVGFFKSYRFFLFHSVYIDCCCEDCGDWSRHAATNILFFFYFTLYYVVTFGFIVIKKSIKVCLAGDRMCR